MFKLLLRLGLLVLLAVYLVPKFVYFDVENGCVIRIGRFILPSSFNPWIALNIIKKNYPERYAYICKNVNKIDMGVGCGGFDGGCFYQSQKNSINIGNDIENNAWGTAIIMHEVCHLKQFQEGRPMSEEECYKYDSEVLGKITVTE